jgi:hypothetical protein
MFFILILQFFYFDSVESLPVEPLEPGDLKPENTLDMMHRSVCLDLSFKANWSRQKSLWLVQGRLDVSS